MGCARPSLGVDDDGGEVAPVADAGAGVDAEEAPLPPDEPDSSSEVAEVVDARTPSITADDAGCGDRDRDTICDAVDNCPDDANTDQADADRNGTGDACEVVEVNCQGDQLETGLISNVATLARMRINGESDKVVNVAPGADVTVSFDLTFSDCDGFALQSLVLGVESTLECTQPAGCTVVAVPLPYEFTFKAPDSPGLHYLLAALRDTFSTSSRCTPGSSNAPAAKRVAALCVSR